MNAAFALLLLAISASVLALPVSMDLTYPGTTVIGGVVRSGATSDSGADSPPSTSTSGDVVAEARKYLGKLEYLFGGNDLYNSRDSRGKLVQGADCSSFVQLIFRRVRGKYLPRTASQQYRVGTPVAFEQLQPGDLVFFKNTYKSGISHVGIYSGSCKFINAPSSGRTVSEDDLCRGYWKAHYAGAKRV